MNCCRLHKPCRLAGVLKGNSDIIFICRAHTPTHVPHLLKQTSITNTVIQNVQNNSAQNKVVAISLHIMPIILEIQLQKIKEKAGPEN